MSETKILRRRDVQSCTGLPLSSLYGLIQRGEFPAPIKLSARRVGWRSDEVDQWIAKRTAERDAQPRRKRSPKFSNVFDNAERALSSNK